MSIVQTYVLTAGEGQESALARAAGRLAAAVRPLPGCEGVTLLRDDKEGRRFIFMETFADAAAHKASSALMPKDIMADLMATLDGRPDAWTCSVVEKL